MKDRKPYRFEIRLSKEEYNLFQQKARRYRSVAAMVRDAVKQHDDVLVKGKIDVLREVLALYKKYQQDLGWYGSNLNQAMHQANSLALDGKLTATFMNDVLLPKIVEAVSFLRNVKDEQTQIYRKLIKL